MTLDREVESQYSALELWRRIPNNRRYHRAVTPSQAVDPGSRQPRTRLLACVAVLTLAGAGLLVHVSPWLADGLGDSHDGYNAAIWGLGARGAVEDPVGNRLGGIHPDGMSYANHPPLLVWTLTPIVAIRDDWPLGLRLVPLLGSLTAIGILAGVLRDSGVGTMAQTAGVLLAGSSAMLLTYGAMVDTPVFGFPFALAALWVAQRSWQARPPPPWLAVLCGALAALAGWQALLTVVVAAAVAGVRRSPPSRRGAAFLMLGGLGGLLVTLAWVWWVSGGLSTLLDQGANRTGMDFGAWFSQQVEFSADLFGPALFMVVCIGTTIAVALPTYRWRRGRPTNDRSIGNFTGGHVQTTAWETPRPLAIVIVVVVIGYSVLFRHGAWVHSYWNYYGIALVGVTTAALMETAEALLQAMSPSARKVTTGLLGFMCLMIAATSWGTRSQADLEIQTGLEVVPLLEQLPHADQPHEVVVATVGGDPVKPWLRWTTHGTNEAVDPGDVTELNPHRQVLITLPLPPPASLWDRTSAEVNGHFALLPAGELEPLMKR